jgi:4-hydroxybenzoate polyprenyltransferase
MKTILKLIRIQNLLIVIVTMYLVRFSLIKPILNFYEENLAFAELDFLLLVLATVFIMAAGNIINDFFDLEIDKINKPEKIIIDNTISIETSRIIYFVLNLVGVAIGIYLSFKIDQIQLSLIFVLTAYLLYAYSKKYKRNPFIGNFIVSALSAFTLFVVWLFEYFAIQLESVYFEWLSGAVLLISKIVLAYVLFAFFVSLIREMIKDIEDVEGDSRMNCRTIPVLLGVNKSKFVIGFLILVAIVFMSYAQIILWQHDLQLVFWYFMFSVQPLFVYLFIYLAKAKTKKHFHYLSTLTKLIMLTGILSIFLIQMY